jgi:hypothetical protein
VDFRDHETRDDRCSFPKCKFSLVLPHWCVVAITSHDQSSLDAANLPNGRFLASATTGAVCARSSENTIPTACSRAHSGLSMLQGNRWIPNRMNRLLQCDRSMIPTSLNGAKHGASLVKVCVVAQKSIYRKVTRLNTRDPHGGASEGGELGRGTGVTGHIQYELRVGVHPRCQRFFAYSSANLAPVAMCVFTPQASRPSMARRWRGSSVHECKPRGSAADRHRRGL